MRLFACATPFRSISRPRWLNATSQCRPFHLLQATFPGDVPPLAPSRREILDFGYVANYKKPSKTHIRIRSHKDGKVHEMGLERVLLKFAKPGMLLLPNRKLNVLKGRLYHYFQPIDIRSVRHHISKKRNTLHEYHFFTSRVDDDGLFDYWMAEIFVLLLLGKRVEIQVHGKGLKDRKAFQKVLDQNIYLRPDVILAAMPGRSRLIIEPCTNYGKVCWVMEGPCLHLRETFGLVQPPSQMDEFHKRRLEVMRAVTDEYAARLRVREEDHADMPSELKDEAMQHMDQDTTNLPASLKASREEVEAQAKMLSESFGSFPTPPAQSTLSLEEQEMEDYRKLEEITGFRLPEP